jgi:SMC interacting uncharacterized protein involved in chromosome segregation
MPKLDEQISTLEVKLRLLKLRHQRGEARKKAIESKRERKADKRRKILVGGVVLARIARKEMDPAMLQEWRDVVAASLVRRMIRAADVRARVYARHPVHKHSPGLECSLHSLSREVWVSALIVHGVPWLELMTQQRMAS